MSPSSRLLIVKRFSSAQLDDLLSLRQVALEQDGGAPSFYPHLLITERRASNFYGITITISSLHAYVCFSFCTSG